MGTDRGEVVAPAPGAAAERGFVKVFREGRRPSMVHSAARKFRESPLAQLYSAAYAEISGLPDGTDPVIETETRVCPPSGWSPCIGDAPGRRARGGGAGAIPAVPRETASAAPFIGLFGTVFGIMSAFPGIGTQGSASLAVVAPGISEALVATAAGLGAAIPAVMGYNYFVNRVRHWATEMDGFILDLLNILSRPMPRLARPAKDGV